MIDQTTLQLVRRTARAFFESSPSPVDAARLGWLGLLVPENLGGSGWHPIEASVIAEEAGRALSPLPWDRAALAAAALATSTTTANWLADILNGDREAALFAGDVADSEKATITGRLALAPGGVLPQLLVAAAEAPGVFVALETDDTVRVGSDLGLDSTRDWRRLGMPASAASPLDRNELSRIMDAATLLACADTVGALGLATETILGHLTQRTAFGAPLASFQVLQHRLVDLTLFQLTARTIVQQAAELLGEETGDSAAMVDKANIYVHSRAAAVLDDCIQLAGGIGFTWEFPIHHAMRRATANAGAFRPWSSSEDRLALAEGW